MKVPKWPKIVENDVCEASGTILTDAARSFRRIPRSGPSPGTAQTALGGSLSA